MPAHRGFPQVGGHSFVPFWHKNTPGGCSVFYAVYSGGRYIKRCAAAPGSRNCIAEKALPSAAPPAGYYPCPGNTVLLKADNHAAAVAKMLEARGVHYYWSWLPAKVGYDKYDEGAAVFSRAPITDAENLLLSQINDYNNWKTRRTLGVCAGDVWYYTVHLGWWKDEVEPFAPQWEKLSKAAGAKKTAFLLGDFNSEADVRGEGYDLVLGSGWQDTYRLAQQRDDGYTVVEAIDGWRDAPDAAAKKRIDQIWCSKAVAVKSSRVVFGGLQEPQVSDHAGVMIEL